MEYEGQNSEYNETALCDKLFSLKVTERKTENGT